MGTPDPSDTVRVPEGTRTKEGRKKTYVLIQKEPRAADAQLAEQLSSVPGVHRVLHVEGPFDVIAEVEGHDMSMQEAVPRISRVEGVLRAIPLHVKGDDGS
jgi:DNA-binding Lrp family transcriptional regulator